MSWRPNWRWSASDMRGRSAISSARRRSVSSSATVAAEVADEHLVDGGAHWCTLRGARSDRSALRAEERLLLMIRSLRSLIAHPRPRCAGSAWRTRPGRWCGHRRWSTAATATGPAAGRRAAPAPSPVGALDRTGGGGVPLAVLGHGDRVGHGRGRRGRGGRCHRRRRGRGRWRRRRGDGAGPWSGGALVGSLVAGRRRRREGRLVGGRRSRRGAGEPRGGRRTGVHGRLGRPLGAEPGGEPFGHGPGVAAAGGSGAAPAGHADVRASAPPRRARRTGWCRAASLRRPARRRRPRRAGRRRVSSDTALRLDRGEPGRQVVDLAEDRPGDDHQQVGLHRRTRTPVTTCRAGRSRRARPRPPPPAPSAAHRGARPGRPTPGRAPPGRRGRARAGSSDPVGDGSGCVWAR